MTVQVEIPTILRTYTGGNKKVDAAPGTLESVIVDLDANFPGLEDRLVDNGKLRQFVRIYLNDEDVRFTGGLETEVDDDDVLTILPAVAGGSVASEVTEQLPAAVGGALRA
ncbi:MAG: MoaD/ThiS family protein [Candidatus Nanopelagicales bacterium]